MKNIIRIKRVYETKKHDDGYRILVDRLWPRGMSKEKAGIDLWLKEIAPSTELRKWFNHDPGKWPEFQQRYEKELTMQSDAVRLLNDILHEKKSVTLLFSASDIHYNNASALQKILQKPGSKHSFQ